LQSQSTNPSPSPPGHLEIAPLRPAIGTRSAGTLVPASSWDLQLIDNCSPTHISIAAPGKLRTSWRCSFTCYYHCRLAICAHLTGDPCAPSSIDPHEPSTIYCQCQLDIMAYLAPQQAPAGQMTADQTTAIVICTRSMSILSLLGSCYILSTFMTFSFYRKRTSYHLYERGRGLIVCLELQLSIVWSSMRRGATSWPTLRHSSQRQAFPMTTLCGTRYASSRPS
jgi:hypothetical protein